MTKRDKLAFATLSGRAFFNHWSSFMFQTCAIVHLRDVSFEAQISEFEEKTSVLVKSASG